MKIYYLLLISSVSLLFASCSNSEPIGEYEDNSHGEYRENYEVTIERLLSEIQGKDKLEGIVCDVDSIISNTGILDIFINMSSEELNQILPDYANTKYQMVRSEQEDMALGQCHINLCHR